MAARDDQRPSARQLARGQTRRAGDRSAALAGALMRLPAAAVKRLQVDDDLRAELDRARAVTALVARRRAERTLAGALRRHDLDDVARQLASIREEGSADARELHLAERWRAQLLEQGPAALAGFPGGGDAELPRLLDAARRERATGRPPGAARALFRHIVALLKAGAPGARGAGDADADDDPGDDADDGASRDGEAGDLDPDAGA